GVFFAPVVALSRNRRAAAAVAADFTPGGGIFFARYSAYLPSPPLCFLSSRIFFTQNNFLVMFIA
ncbi:MAG: hypothetical protein J6R86_02295, partial [Lentisphaeria bacterium]|nr:hypothetical protein [Lentisphaeria bacterium]